MSNTAPKSIKHFKALGLIAALVIEITFIIVKPSKVLAQALQFSIPLPIPSISGTTPPPSEKAATPNAAPTPSTLGGERSIVFVLAAPSDAQTATALSVEVAMNIAHNLPELGDYNATIKPEDATQITVHAEGTDDEQTVFNALQEQFNISPTPTSYTLQKQGEASFRVILTPGTKASLQGDAALAAAERLTKNKESMKVTTKGTVDEQTVFDALQKQFNISPVPVPVPASYILQKQEKFRVLLARGMGASFLQGNAAFSAAKRLTKNKEITKITVQAEGTNDEQTVFDALQKQFNIFPAPASYTLQKQEEFRVILMQDMGASFLQDAAAIAAAESLQTKNQTEITETLKRTPNIKSLTLRINPQNHHQGFLIPNDSQDKHKIPVDLLGKENKNIANVFAKRFNEPMIIPEPTWTLDDLARQCKEQPATRGAVVVGPIESDIGGWNEFLYANDYTRLTAGAYLVECNKSRLQVSWASDSFVEGRWQQGGVPLLPIAILGGILAGHTATIISTTPSTVTTIHSPGTTQLTTNNGPTSSTMTGSNNSLTNGAATTNTSTTNVTGGNTTVQNSATSSSTNSTLATSLTGLYAFSHDLLDKKLPGSVPSTLLKHAAARLAGALTSQLAACGAPCTKMFSIATTPPLPQPITINGSTSLNVGQ